MRANDTMYSLLYMYLLYTAFDKSKNKFATSKVKKINLAIGLLSLGIYAPGPHVQKIYSLLCGAWHGFTKNCTSCIPNDQYRQGTRALLGHTEAPKPRFQGNKALCTLPKHCVYSLKRSFLRRVVRPVPAPAVRFNQTLLQRN